MDAFAQIAKSGIQGRYEFLEQPKPTPLPDHVVCLKETNAQPTVLPEKNPHPGATSCCSGGKASADDAVPGKLCT